MVLIGSHVSFNKDKQLLGALEEALSYGSNCFMFYTGAPQNTIRVPLNDMLTYKAMEVMKEKGIDINNVIVHAPYIINLANPNNRDFSIDFLINECKRCEDLFVNKLVLHPGSHVGLGSSIAIDNIAAALNKVLSCTETTILLEVMAGKGTEVGCTLEQIKSIIEKIDEQGKIGICLDTCHLNDGGYDISCFDDIIEKLKELNLLSKVLCIHLNDSKNLLSSHKDRHENIGYGTIGFENLINVCYNETFKDIPKILETPFINDLPPYKEEIEEIKTKTFNSKLKDN